MKPVDVDLIAVTYFGYDEPFIERNYQSGLTFETGQTRMLPAALANRLLRHEDVFGRGELENATVVAALTGDAETERMLAEANIQQTIDSKQLTMIQDMICQVNVMDKDALKDFAQVKYGQAIPKTMSVENMRVKVGSLIDQFGLV